MNGYTHGLDKSKWPPALQELAETFERGSGYWVLGVDTETEFNSVGFPEGDYGGTFTVRLRFTPKRQPRIDAKHLYRRRQNKPGGYIDRGY